MQGSTSREGSTSSLEKKEAAKQQDLSASEKQRHWELIVSVRGFTYVGSEKRIDTFFAISVRPENPKVRHRVKLLTEYTPAYVLKRMDRFPLDTPIILYQRKKFSLSYHQVQKHVLQVDMWKVHSWTFNQYYGSGRIDLWDVANRDPNLSIKVKEKLTKHDEAEKKKMKRPISDVAVLECTVNLEELFDVHLLYENWTLELDATHPDAEARLAEKKSLTFVIPRSCLSDPLKKKGCRVFRVPWKGGEQQKAVEKKFWWQHVSRAPFIFRGTRTSLENMFFIVMVHSGNPIGNRMPFSSIGSSLLGLTSVLNVSVFKGKVKALSTQEECFNVGTITGSVKALLCSFGEHSVEEIPGGRPEQTRTALSVTHLTKMRYLVVRVSKCEGLAVADADTFSSDPYVRVCWDNMVHTSPIIEKTTAPVFNHTFYFPVRPFNPKLEAPRYQDSALLYELKAKGDISIQVWDDDGTSADSLGFVRLTMRQMVMTKFTQKRTLRGIPISSMAGEDEEEEVKRSPQWYDKEGDVRVFDGNKTELTGCTLPNSQTALISFEAYFFPDWSETLAAKADSVLKAKSEINYADLWRQKELEFDRENAEFSRGYAVPFPDSIGARPCKEDTLRSTNLRRFPCLGAHPQTLEVIPLMAFLVRITTDDDYSSPMMLLHWTNCITYLQTASQDRNGLIPSGGWKDPQFLLFTRKGPVQDHALLLCSLLLGCGKDAYVCKGTLWNRDLRHAASQDQDDKAHHTYDEPLKLVEHVWVMTREAGGWVTFWEPCTREMYHMPHRWTPSASRTRASGRDGKDSGQAPMFFSGSEEEDPDQLALPSPDPEEECTVHARDVALLGEDLDPLPTHSVHRSPKAKAKSGSGRERLKQQYIEQRGQLPTAPQPHLLNTDEKNGTLVDWLPYDSIDVVFNMDNLWANRQNHHPACIMYDFEATSDCSSGGWSRLLKDDDERQKISYEFINADVLIDPVLKPEKLTRLESETVSEMEENMRLYRQKRGHDTWWDKSPELLQQLEDFLDIHEQMRLIDVDLCPIWQKRPEELDVYEKYLVRLKFGNCRAPYNKYGTPFNYGRKVKKYQAYLSEQARAYERLLEAVKSFVDRKKLFPTKKGKLFSGFPVHFCTVDKDEIRGYLMHQPEYVKLLERTEEGLEFTIHCRIHGLLGGIQSTWLYFGVQRPMA